MEINLEGILELAESFESLKPEALGNPDFYDPAIVGITDDGKLVYSKEMMIKLLYESENIASDIHEIDYDTIEFVETIEFLQYNCWSSYVGEMTPIFINQSW